MIKVWARGIQFSTINVNGCRLGCDGERSNCQPFAFGDKLFMPNGQIGGFKSIWREVAGLVLLKFYNVRMGAIDSERI